MGETEIDIEDDFEIGKFRKIKVQNNAIKQEQI